LHLHIRHFTIAGRGERRHADQLPLLYTRTVCHFSRHSGETKRFFKTMLDVLSMLVQAAAFIIWPMTIGEERSPPQYNAFLIPVVCVMISLGWWENFIDKNSAFGYMRRLARIKERLHRTRYFIYIFISVWKVILIFMSMVACFYYIDGSSSLAIFSKFKEAFGSHKILIQRDRSDLLEFANTDQFVGVEGETFELNSRSSTSLWFIFVQIVATWCCYVVAKFTCKICIQFLHLSHYEWLLQAPSVLASRWDRRDRVDAWRAFHRRCEGPH